MTGDTKEGSYATGLRSNWPRDETFRRSQETSVQEDDTDRIPSVFGFILFGEKNLFDQGRVRG